MNRDVELAEKTEETSYFWVYIGAAIFIVALCAIGGYLIWRQKYSSEPQKENTTLVDYQTSDRLHDTVEYQQSDTAGSTNPAQVQNSFFARHWKTIVFGIAATGFGSYFLYNYISSSSGPDQADQDVTSDLDAQEVKPDQPAQEADNKVGSVSTAGTSASDQGVGFTRKQLSGVLSTAGTFVAGCVWTVVGGASDLLSNAGTSVVGAWTSFKPTAEDAWTAGKSAAGSAWTVGSSVVGSSATAVAEHPGKIAVGCVGLYMISKPRRSRVINNLRQLPGKAYGAACWILYTAWSIVTGILAHLAAFWYISVPLGVGLWYF